MVDAGSKDDKTTQYICMLLKLLTLQLGAPKVRVTCHTADSRKRCRRRLQVRISSETQAIPAWRSSKNNKDKSSTLSCKHFKRCSGCTLENNLDKPPEASQAQRYFRQNGISKIQVTSGPPHGWRLRARLAVRGNHQKPVIGLYATGTHAAIDIPLCRYPDIAALIAEICICDLGLYAISYS